VFFEVVSISCLQFRLKVVDSNLENVPFVESASSQHQHGDNRTYINDVQEPLKQASKQRTSVRSAEAYSVFCTVNSSGRRMVRCSICCKYPDVARMFSNKKNQLPALCTESGTAPRKELLKAHLTSEMHRQYSALDLSETLPSDLKEAVSS